MTGIRSTKLFVALVVLCLAVASVTAAQAHTTGARQMQEGPSALSLEGGRLKLNGEPFFLVAATGFSSCPTPEVVGDYLSMGVNTIIHIHWPCNRMETVTADVLHGLLQNRLWWLELGRARQQQIDGAPELLQSDLSVNLDSNPGVFYGCNPYPPLNTTEGLFNRIRKSPKSAAFIYRTRLLDPLERGNANCHTPQTIKNVFWTVVAAGGDGISYDVQWGLHPNDRAQMNDRVVAAAKLQYERLKSLPCILNGEPIAGPDGPEGVVFGAWKLGDQTCVVAVNTVKKAVAAKLYLPTGLKRRSAKVQWESRVETPVKGIISDNFQPLEVQIYRFG